MSPEEAYLLIWPWFNGTIVVNTLRVWTKGRSPNFLGMFCMCHAQGFANGIPDTISEAQPIPCKIVGDVCILGLPTHQLHHKQKRNR